RHCTIAAAPAPVQVVDAPGKRWWMRRENGSTTGRVGKGLLEKLADHSGSICSKPPRIGELPLAWGTCSSCEKGLRMSQTHLVPTRATKTLTQKRVRRSVAALSTAALCAVGLSVPAYAADTDVHLSEIHYDNQGTDTGEAIEVQGAEGTDLTGWQVVLYNGKGGAAYSSR